jgi:hypothetical protein
MSRRRTTAGKLATVLVLRVDGTQETHQQPVDDVFKWATKAIGAVGKGLDLVNLRDGRVMLVDGYGYEVEEQVQEPTPDDPFTHIRIVPTKARRPVNAEATRLYLATCRPGTTHQIVGDVAIVNDNDFAEDGF